MYKEYLHTLSKYCINIVVLLYCTFNSSFIFKTLHRAVCVGETGVGKTGVGEQGISRVPVVDSLKF